MLREIAFYRVLGMPLIMLDGLLAFLFFGAAAVVGRYGARLGIRNYFKLHLWLAGTGLLIALSHLLINLAIMW
ncbi:MAG: hypothetical protein WCT10_00695 [Patescibacteria group bacterium]